MSKRPLRLLHTSDLHLGAHHDDKELAVLRRVIELGRDSKADVLLLAGDIFDHNRVKAEFIERAREVMESSPSPMVILPGNHDCLLAGGVYERGGFGKSERIHVLGLDGGEVAALHDLGLTAWGRAHRDHRDLRPLHDPPDFDPNGWRVAIAHGHLVQTKEDERRAYKILPEEIEAQPADYVALGHWDVYTEASSSGRAFYSGSPLYAGTVNLVELEPDKDLTLRRIPFA